MQRIWLLLLVFIIPLFIPGQQTNVQKSHYGDSLLNLANDIFYSNPDSSLNLTNYALNYALKHKLDVLAAQAWRSQAKHDVLKGEVEQALKRLRDAVRVFEKYNEKEQVARCYNLMSTAVSKLNDNEACIKWLLKAAEIYKGLKLKNGYRTTLLNLANSYADIGEYEKGLTALDEVKQYIEPNSDTWFYYYINTGIIYRLQKKYALSKIQFDSCLAISRRHRMIDAEITAITDLAVLLGETGHAQKAIENFKKAIELSRLNKLPIEEKEALTGLMSQAEKSRDYKLAYQSQNRLKVISDSLFNLEKIKNISVIETKLKLSEKEKTIALQKLDMEKNSREKEKTKKRIVYLIAGTLLLAAILFFTIFVYVKTRRQKREVELQKGKAERLNSLNQKIFSVIAHDFKSPLITLQMLTDLMDKEHLSRENMSSYTADVRNQIIQSNQILENLLNWAKTELNLSHNTKLVSNASAIADEIEKELNYMTSKKEITFVNLIPGQALFNVPPDILKIIIRNLVSNAVKYSYEQSVVELGMLEKDEIYVKDSGVGIDEEKINNLFTGIIKSKLGTFNETGFGLGLHITHELVTKFGGKIRVKKNETGGTVFIFALPLHA